VKCIGGGIERDTPENVTAIANSQSRGSPISLLFEMIESESGKGIQVDQLLPV
jgi:hypothetical protein